MSCCHKYTVTISPVLSWTQPVFLIADIILELCPDELNWRLYSCTFQNKNYIMT